MNDHYDRRSPVTGKVSNPMDGPRYLGMPTLLRAPQATSLKEVDIAVVGVPFDGGVTNRPGARHGPRELRNQAGMVRSIHPVTRINPFEVCTVVDVGDVEIESLYDLEAAQAEIEAFFRRLCEQGVVPLAAGGDHSIVYPILRAVANDGPIGLIQVDAHTDTWDEFGGSRVHHGAPIRRAIEDGRIDPRRAVQIGIRGPQDTMEGWSFAVDVGIRVIAMDEAARVGIDRVIEEARRVVGDGPVYLTYDIDSLDPTFAPGTGTPEIGGLTSLEAQTLLRGLRGLDFVGADLVEVAPPFDPSGLTALVGATLLYEQVCLLTEAISRRREL
jgi:guanidinopropionase